MAADGKTGGGRGVTPPHRTIPTTLAWVRTRWWVTPPPPSSTPSPPPPAAGGPWRGPRGGGGGGGARRGSWAQPPPRASIGHCPVRSCGPGCAGRCVRTGTLYTDTGGAFGRFKQRGGLIG